MSKVYNSTDSFSDREYTTPNSSGFLPSPTHKFTEIVHPLSQNLKSSNYVEDKYPEHGLCYQSFDNSTNPSTNPSTNLLANNELQSPPHIPTPTSDLEPIPEMRIYPEKRGYFNKLFVCFWDLCQCTRPRKPQTTYME